MSRTRALVAHVGHSQLSPRQSRPWSSTKLQMSPSISLSNILWSALTAAAVMAPIMSVTPCYRPYQGCPWSPPIPTTPLPSTPVSAKPRTRSPSHLPSPRCTASTMTKSSPCCKVAPSPQCSRPTTGRTTNQGYSPAISGLPSTTQSSWLATPPSTGSSRTNGAPVGAKKAT